MRWCEIYNFGVEVDLPLLSGYVYKYGEIWLWRRDRTLF